MTTTVLLKFLSLHWKERYLLLEAFIWLGLSRVALLIIPFKRIAPHLGKQVKEVGETQNISLPPAWIKQIGWAVETMSHHTPWESACLAQAMTAKFMLQRRGISSILYLGMKKDADGKLSAHAWLKVGEVILVGGTGHETFAILSGFVDK